MNNMITLKEKLESFLEEIFKIKLNLSSIDGLYADLSCRVDGLNEAQLMRLSSDCFSSINVVNGYLNLDINENFISKFEKFKFSIKKIRVNQNLSYILNIYHQI